MFRSVRVWMMMMSLAVAGRSSMSAVAAVANEATTTTTTTAAAAASPSSYAAVERRQLLMLDSDAPYGCLEVKNGKTRAGTRLILGDCSNYERGFDFETLFKDGDSVDRYHSRIDDSMCMDAGGKSGNSNLRSGKKLRLMPCDDTKTSQLFSWVSSMPVTFDDPDLCVVYRGTRRAINEDPIILKDCNVVLQQRRFKDIPKTWSCD